MGGLPTDRDVSRVTVELNEKERSFIKTRRASGRPLKALRFLAFVTMDDGTKFVLKDKVKLERPGK